MSVISIMGSVQLSHEALSRGAFTTALGTVSEISLFLSLGTNVLITLLLAGRIYYLAWKLHRGFPKSQRKKYMSAVGIIVESGALFLAAQVTLVAIFAVHSSAVWIPINSVAQIYVGPVLPLRVGFADPEGADSALHLRSLSCASALGGLTGRGASKSGGRLALGPLACRSLPPCGRRPYLRASHPRRHWKMVHTMAEAKTIGGASTARSSF